MADNKVDVSFSDSGAGALEVNTGGGESDFKQDHNVGAGQDFEFGMRHTKEEDKKDAPIEGAGAGTGETLGEEAQGEGTAAADGAGEPTTLNVIEAFNPEDADNVASWNKEYVLEDGTFNADRFAKELDANLSKEGGKPELNAATYDFMKSKGVSKEVLDTIIANEMNARATKEQSASKDTAEVFETAGKVLDTALDGADILKEALEWGKKNYSKEQIDRYEKAVDGSKEDRLEAVELLLTRYGKTEDFKTAEASRKEAARQAARKTEPRRDVTQNANTRAASGLKPFANVQEWRAQRRADGEDPQKIALTFKRAQLSGLA